MNTLYPPTINTVVTPANGFYQVVTGTKAANIHIFCRNNGGPWGEALYQDGLSGLRWTNTFALSSGTNLIEAISRQLVTAGDDDSTASTATIHLIVQTPETYNVWNNFDEFGLLLSLPRIPGENNTSYRARLLDVYINPANSTFDGLVNGISRELGVPTSSVLIYQLSDLMDPGYAGNLLNASGNALGTKLVDYADEVYDHNPVFWGNVIADESFWDGVDEETNGYSFLPHIWDPMASGVYDKWQTSGIGDNDDLWVDGPTEEWNENIGAYSWYMKVHSGYFYSAYPSGAFSQ